MNKSSVQLYIGTSITILGVLFFGVYELHTYVTGFSSRSSDIHMQVEKLQEKKKTIELYRKILAEGSQEQDRLNTYILSGDAVFTAVTDLEKDGKKIGLFTPGGGILSVSKREGESLKNLQAGEVIVQMAVEGDANDVDLYIQSLTNLPYASYVEKVSLNFSKENAKTKADITLVIIELI